MADTVIKQDGTLDKFIGDCVMAFWGAPTPNPKHALACVRAAIEAQRAVYQLNQQRSAENKKREAGEPGPRFRRPAAQAPAADSAPGQRHQHRHGDRGVDGLRRRDAELHRLRPRSESGQPPGERFGPGPHLHRPDHLRALAARRSGLGRDLRRVAPARPQGLPRRREGL